MRHQLLNLLSLVSSALAIPLYNASHSPILKAALVRAPPALWSEPILSRDYHGVDINATTALGVEYIERAASEGANLIAFPELWFPGYPRGNNATWLEKWGPQYVSNSLTLNDSNWNALVSAARKNAIYVALSFSELQNNHIFIAQALLDPNGEILIHRHKLRPSGGERLIWSDGTMNELIVVDTPFGRIGQLSCWEHFHPSMTFPMQAQKEAIHIGAWPYMPDFGVRGAEAWERAEVNMAAASVYATNSGAYVLAPSVGRAAVFGPDGLEVSHVGEGVSGKKEPFLLVGIDTTGVVGGVPFDVEGEQSWGVLEEIRDGWPGDVPKVKGVFTERVLNDVRSF
ncbi:aliphatic nitrilase-like protein [Aspergillus stella-maris]|uniref:aliphatic nitrilase-like protein n=1 Tax=Aspergillus stella-maris TaxID=1810926 RepID=UPI003CCDF2D9